MRMIILVVFFFSCFSFCVRVWMYVWMCVSVFKDVKLAVMAANVTSAYRERERVMLTDPA